MFLLVIYL